MSKPQIVVTSGVATADGNAFVAISWGEMSGQLDTEAAKQFALSIIEAATDAERDAGLARWGKKVGMDDPQIVGMFRAIRENRGEPPTRSGRAES